MISVLTIGSLYWSSCINDAWRASYQQRDGEQQCTSDQPTLNILELIYFLQVAVPSRLWGKIRQSLLSSRISFLLFCRCPLFFVSFSSIHPFSFHNFRIAQRAATRTSRPESSSRSTGCDWWYHFSTVLAICHCKNKLSKIIFKCNCNDSSARWLFANSWPCPNCDKQLKTNHNPNGKIEQ